MTAAVDAAPAASAIPGHDTKTTVAGYREPLIIACALAGSDRQLAHMWMFPDTARAVVADTLRDHDLPEILAWRDRIPPGEWAIRWEAARKLVGLLMVPDYYDHYDRAESPTPIGT